MKCKYHNLFLIGIHNYEIKSMYIFGHKVNSKIANLWLTFLPGFYSSFSFIFIWGGDNFFITQSLLTTRVYNLCEQTNVFLLLSRFEIKNFEIQDRSREKQIFSNAKIIYWIRISVLYKTFTQKREYYCFIGGISAVHLYEILGENVFQSHGLFHRWKKCNKDLRFVFGE